MANEKDEPSGFKVVDRRSFDAEGSRREGSPVDDNRKPDPREEGRKPNLRPTPAPARAVEAEAETPYDYDEGPTGFDTLVSYLSTTTMFQLGLLPGPGGERIPADLVNARRTIDLLEVLQDKTRGNLTPSEAKLLEDVLYELRLSFVEIEKRVAQKAR